MATARAATCLVVASLALSACAAGSDGAATVDRAESPLAPYIALIYGTDEPDRAQGDRQVQYLTAACMTQRGFDYTPDDPAPATGADQDRPDDPAWVARWGYGIVEHPDAGGQSISYRPTANQLYVSSLNGVEYAAYYGALYGDGSGASSWASSCYGAASAAVFGDDVTRAPENEWLVSAIENFDASPPNDPDLAAIDAEWSACMATAGYDGIRSPTDARRSVDASVAAVDVERTDQLAAAHRDEVELALADLGCRQDVDYGDRYTRIQYAAEEDFLSYTKPQLDALVAQAEAARAAVGR